MLLISSSNYGSVNSVNMWRQHVNSAVLSFVLHTSQWVQRHCLSQRANLQQISGVTFLVVFRYLMFPCSSLRDDCGFHWDPEILMKFVDSYEICRFWPGNLQTQILHTRGLGLSSSKVFQMKDQSSQVLTKLLHFLCTFLELQSDIVN